MKNFLNSKLFITVIVIGFLVFMAQWGYNKYMNLKTELRISEQNESALKDSIRHTTNELKQSEYSKQILVAQNAKELAKLNEKMADKLGGLEGKISSLTSTVIELSGLVEDMDSIVTQVVDVSPPDSTGTSIKAFRWSYEKRFDEDNYRAIAGETTFSVDSTLNVFKALKTSITKDIINFEITQGLRTTEDGKVEMFATSNYPKFEVKELNSVLIDPETHPALKKFSKRKRFNIGIYTGVGGTVNLSNFQMIFGPQFGVGGTWTLFDK